MERPTILAVRKPISVMTMTATTRPKARHREGQVMVGIVEVGQIGLHPSIGPVDEGNHQPCRDGDRRADDQAREKVIPDRVARKPRTRCSAMIRVSRCPFGSRRRSAGVTSGGSIFGSAREGRMIADNAGSRTADKVGGEKYCGATSGRPTAASLLKTEAGATGGIPMTMAHPCRGAGLRQPPPQSAARRCAGADGRQNRERAEATQGTFRLRQGDRRPPRRRQSPPANCSARGWPVNHRPVPDG